jgi:hypothetical protein
MKHNHIAIVAAVCFQQLLSYLWYSEGLFLSSWLTAANMLPSEAVFKLPHPVMASLLGSAMFCYLLSWLFQILVIDDWVRGLIVGALIGLGFLAPVLATHYLYLGFGPEIVWIDCSRQVISAGGAGIILAIWAGEPTAEAT